MIFDDKKFNILPKLLLIILLSFLVQGCAISVKQKIAPQKNQISLKELHDRLIETNLGNIYLIENVVGRLSELRRNSDYIHYTSESSTTVDGYEFFVSEVRVRTKNTSDIVMAGLDIKSNSCLSLSSIAREYGSDAMGIKDATSHGYPLPNGVIAYSTITNEWGYVNFGFDRKACLKNMVFFKGKP